MQVKISSSCYQLRMTFHCKANISFSKHFRTLGLLALTSKSILDHSPHKTGPTWKQGSGKGYTHTLILTVPIPSEICILVYYIVVDLVFCVMMRKWVVLCK